jgi:NAD(P)-dependent dehydrogenase (short-subunit alcohol dehydrogenase family)
LRAAGRGCAAPAACSRWYTAASNCHGGGSLLARRFGRINSPQGYDPFKAYGQSKLANILLARQMAEELRGWPVAVAACHPGVVNTGWTRHIGLPSWMIGCAFALTQ